MSALESVSLTLLYDYQTGQSSTEYWELHALLIYMSHSLILYLFVVRINVINMSYNRCRRVYASSSEYLITSPSIEHPVVLQYLTQEH